MFYRLMYFVFLIILIFKIFNERLVFNLLTLLIGVFNKNAH